MIVSGIAAAALSLAGVSLFSVQAHALPRTPAGAGGFTGDLRVHWSLIAIGLAALVGVLLLLLGKHEKPNP